MRLTTAEAAAHQLMVGDAAVWFGTDLVCTIITPMRPT